MPRFLQSAQLFLISFSLLRSISFRFNFNIHQYHQCSFNQFALFSLTSPFLCLGGISYFFTWIFITFTLALTISTMLFLVFSNSLSYWPNLSLNLMNINLEDFYHILRFGYSIKPCSRLCFVIALPLKMFNWVYIWIFRPSPKKHLLVQSQQ